MRFYHLHDPWVLTLAQWNGLLDRISDITAMETPDQGPERHRALIETKKRQQQRTRRLYG